MKNKEYMVSKRLKEVWEWKDLNYREVEKLSCKEALSAILNKAHAVAEKIIHLKKNTDLKTK